MRSPGARRFRKRSFPRAGCRNPELYHNLARVHLAFGFKAEAIRYLRRGLMIDPANAAMLTELNELGMRRSPTLSFLPRRHPMNRLLGRFIGRWGGVEKDEEVPAAQSA
jgi:hypothetical protein